jgi:prepilin-type N-terminal cleavage/methylation domain-containing protein
MFNRKSFTLIELLVVIAIVAILSVIVILVLNPAQLMAQARDSNRSSDMDTLYRAVSLYTTDQGNLGNVSTSIVYVSVPDPAITSPNTTSSCSGIGLSSSNLPGGWSYQCASTSTYRNVNGQGWIPISLSSMSEGSPFPLLPIDPTNNATSGLYYTFIATSTNNQFLLTSLAESQKYKNPTTNPNNSTPFFPGLLAKGTNYTISPLWNPSGLVGYWPMDEGTGATTQDASGNGNTGTATGTLPYYAAGKVGPYAGNFDGSTDYVKISWPMSPDITNSIQSGLVTFCAWINPSSASGEFGVIGVGSSASYGLNLAIVSGQPDYCLPVVIKCGAYQ